MPALHSVLAGAANTPRAIVQDAKALVETWSAEFGKCTDLKKQLAMVYLANDILQNSRTKGAQFVVEFYNKLPPAVGHLYKRGDAKVGTLGGILHEACSALWLFK